MVIHEDNEIPVEVSVIRKPLFEQKTYVIVKNHVREISTNDENKPSVSNPDKKSDNTKNELKKKPPKRKKKDYSSTSSVESGNNAKKVNEISAEDLKELKTVYRNCKAVIEKIETKYGHLLDLDQAGPSGTHGKMKVDYRKIDEHECQCTLNKKIVFDDDGKQLIVDQLLDTHICPKKLKLLQTKPLLEHKNIEIEYNDSNINMPESIKDLYSILQNSDIEITYRNKVIDKVRCLRQEYLNEIKFNKHSLIEKLKSNPDEVLDFKGANLSVLSGYP